MVGQHTIATLEHVLESERQLITQGTTVAITTPLISQSLVDEIKQIKHKGHPVIILYSGDRKPRINIDNVPMFYVNT